MSDTLTKLSYQTFQQGKSYFGIAHRMLGARLMNVISPNKTEPKPIPSEVLLKLKERADNLLEVDWQDAERGIYPKSLLFDNPWEDFLRYYPIVWLDLPQMWERAQHKKYQDFSPEIETLG
ncbi:SAM-dependent methyltransferase, partial [Aetokthonos hydrillicola CCALA 1050]|nr:SAM-dependent methyltransferase [Aetokthonos hydrillicola CCALA 1050]